MGLAVLLLCALATLARFVSWKTRVFFPLFLPTLLTPGLSGGAVHPRTRTPTSAAPQSAGANAPGWKTGFNASFFETALLEWSAESSFIRLSGFPKYDIPEGSTVVGVLLELEICFEAMTAPFHVRARLVNGTHTMAGTDATPSQEYGPAVLGDTGRRCFAAEHSVKMGGPGNLWGAGFIQASQLDATDLPFGVEVGVLVSGKRMFEELRDETNTTTEATTTEASNSTTTEATTTTAETTTTTSATTTHSTSPTTSKTQSSAPTTTHPTTAAPTSPPVHSGGSVKFRNPRVTVYYVTKCRLQEQLQHLAGFECSADGLPEISQPIEVAVDELVLHDQSTVIIRIPRSRELANGHAGALKKAFLTVNGTLQLGGHLVIAFDEQPKQQDVPEHWHLFEATRPIKGAFTSITAKFLEDGLFDILRGFCFNVVPTPNGEAATVFSVNTTLVNTCFQEVMDHPVRAALISVSVIGVVFTAFALLIMWRKRRFDQRRRSMLSSQLELEGSSESELEMQDVARKEVGYAAAAKLIEQRGTTRFEIGDDEEEPEL